MATYAASATLAVRFEPYVEEVHAFFNSCGVDFGSPEQMLPISETLFYPGALRDGVSSIIRAIVYREQEHISHQQLLELMLVAIGGPQFERAPQLAESSRRLMQVIHEAMRFLWRMPSSSSIDPVPEEDQPAPSDTTLDQSASPAALSFANAAEPSSQHFEAFPQVARLDSAPQAVTRRSEPSAEVRNSDDIASFTIHLDPVIGPHVPLETSQPRRNTTSARAASLTRSAPIRFLPAAVGTAAVGALLLAPAVDIVRQHRAASRAEPIRVKARAPRAIVPLPPARPPSETLAPLLVPMEEPPPASAADLPLASQARVSGKAAHLKHEQPARHPVTPQTTVEVASRGTEGLGEAAEPSTAAAPAAVVASAPEAAPSVAEMSQQPVSVPAALMLGYLASAPPPEYPRLARLTRVEGQVAVQAAVASDGTVGSAHAISGPRLLRGAAERAVRQRRYRPYVADGSARPVKTVVTIDFRLHP